MANISMRDMLAAGVHFGHQTRFWNPKMAPYIFGARNKIHIINLENTVPAFNEALEFVRRCRRRAAQGAVRRHEARGRQSRPRSRRCASSMPFVDQRWLGGMLTNYKTIRQSIRRLQELEAQSADGTFERLTKKEALTKRRLMEKLERSLGGIKDMGGLPDALFVVDVQHEHIAVTKRTSSAFRWSASSTPTAIRIGVDYVIPGNDDAIRAVRLYVTAVADAIAEGHAVAGGEVRIDEFVEVDEAGVGTANYDVDEAV